MSGRLLSGRKRRGRGAFPTHIVIAVFVALLILFFWLQFLAAQQIETLGRQIMETNRELERVQRENAALEHAICAETAQERMAQRAEALGYDLQPPVYLLLAEPLAPLDEGRARWLPPYPLPPLAGDRPSLPGVLARSQSAPPGDEP